MSGDNDLLASAISGALRSFASDQGWERTTHSAHDDRLGDLFGLKELRELLANVRVPTGMFRVLRDSVPLPHKPFTVPVLSDGRHVFDALDPVVALQAVSGGSSLLLASLHEYWPRVRTLCATLSEQTALSCEAFAVVSGADSPGFAPHFDPNDQLVVQCAGTKHWKVFAQAGEVPTTGDPVELGDKGPPMFERDLTVGDVLYLPRGCPHFAQSGHSTSVHVTIVMRRLTHSMVLADAWDAALERRRLADQSLPPFWTDDASSAAAAVQDLCRELLSALPDLIRTRLGMDAAPLR